MTFERFARLFGAVCVLATVLFLGCDTGVEPSEGALLGQVSSVGGRPIAGAAVSLDNGRSASTDANGFYSFSDLRVDKAIVVSFSADGFAPTSKSFTIAGGATPAPACVIMAPAAETVEFDAATSSTQRSRDSAVTIEGGSLVDADGNAVTGTVELTATFIDPSTDSVLAFPGSFDNATNQAGESVSLESFGFTVYEVTQDGQEVNLAPGSTALIEYVLPDNAQGTFSPGDTIPLWEFDDSSAVWKEAGTGEVREASDGSGRLAWFADVSHFSSWNCDAPLDETHCIAGRVMFDGNPISGAEVTAVGVTYNGTSTDISGANGTFCIDIKRESTVRLEIRFNGSATPVYTQELVVPNVAASCSTGGCMSIGDISVSFDSCVTGRVTNPEGTPEAGVTVYVVPGETVTTDTDGYYCAATAADQTVYVFAEGRPSVAVTTSASGSCSSGSCAEADLSITLPEAGDVVGSVFAMQMTMIFTGFGFDDGSEDGLDGSQFVLGGQFLTSAFDDSTIPSPFGALGFLSFLGAFDSETEQIGDCTVTTMTFDEDGFGNQQQILGLDIGALDPGTPGTATHGEATVKLWPGDPTTADPPAPFLAGLFASDEDVAELGFGTGQTISFAFPGGTDIGAFAISVDVPDELVLISPDLSDCDLMLDFSSELPLTWTAGAISDEIIVSVLGLSQKVTENPDGNPLVEITYVIIDCTFPDTGSATISAAAMSHLPTESVQSWLEITRVRTTKVEVPLNRVKGKGIVEGRGASSIARFFMDYGDLFDPCNIPDPGESPE